MPVQRQFNIVILLIAILFLSPFAQAETYVKNVTAQASMAFQPGEKLEFVLKWVNIPAGKAVLKVEPFTTIMGVKAYHFVLIVKTNKFVDIFYKVRDRIDAYADVEMDHSVFFKKIQKEGSYKKNSIVRFNWRQKQAQYSVRGDKHSPIPLMPGSFDPLSAFYFIRTIDLKTEKCVKRPITDGKKNVIGVVHIISKQKLVINGKNYDTFLIEPELNHVGGVFRKSKKAKIKLWVTADSRRIPVRIESKVAVGTFSGELISAKGLIN